MPNIVIKEKDLTGIRNTEVTTNAVYIPGYANIGPINEPILCETITDFQLIFGAEPYKFREDQNWDLTTSSTITASDVSAKFHSLWGTNAYATSMGKFYQQYDFEKSYVMATELLKLGLPIIYERVFDAGEDDSNVIKWTAKSTLVDNTQVPTVSLIDIKSSSPGASSADIKYAIESVTSSWSAYREKANNNSFVFDNYHRYSTDSNGNNLLERPTMKADTYTAENNYYSDNDNTFTVVSSNLLFNAVESDVPYSSVVTYYTLETNSYVATNTFTQATEFSQGIADADGYYVIEDSLYVVANPQPTEVNFGDATYYTFNDNTYYTFNSNTYYAISNSTYFESTVNGFTNLTVSITRMANALLGTNTIYPTTTVFTTDINIVRESANVKLLEVGVPILDNTGLVTFTLLNPNGAIQTSEINPDGTFVYESLNLPSTTNKADDEFTVFDIYSLLDEDIINSDKEYQGFGRLLDKGEYVIKFITAGAYPIFEFNDNSIMKKIIKVAGERGDCTAIIDHTPNADRKLSPEANSSVYYGVNEFINNTVITNSLGEDCFIYSAMFTPWATYRCESVDSNVLLPASFDYLTALANQVQYTNNWLATAGCSRGINANLLSLQQNITNAIADNYQPRNSIAINAITNIKPYGFTIWGARTLKNNRRTGDLTATSFLNIRQLTNDVKRQIWVAAKSLTYEQNSDILWLRFKGKLIPLLNQMVQGNGITAYEFIKKQTTKKATIVAIVRLYPVEPVEDWDITVELADDMTATTIG